MATNADYRLGFPELDIVAVAHLIARVTGIDYEPRDSSFLGDYYNYRAPGFDQFILIKNRDPLYLPDTDPPEDRYFEADHRDLACLLDVSANMQQAEALVRKITSEIPQAVIINFQPW